MPNFEASWESLQECRGGVSLRSLSVQSCGAKVVLAVETLSDQNPFREFQFCSVSDGRESVVLVCESVQYCGGYSF